MPAAGVKNRRHAWDYPTQKDNASSSHSVRESSGYSSAGGSGGGGGGGGGFKLSGFLQQLERGGSRRSHGGFQQLDQNASDGEDDDFDEDQSGSESHLGRASPSTANSTTTMA